MTKKIKPLVVLEIYEGDITAEADDLQENIQLSQEQIVRIMQNVKDTLKNDPDFFEEYFAVVRDCIKTEVGLE